MTPAFDWYFVANTEGEVHHNPGATPELFGGKGYGIYQMTMDGLNVPPAIVIPTTMCAAYKADPQGFETELRKHLPVLHKWFGDLFGYMPLLSVRSGARVSMPGMMDTILNVGLDKGTFDFWKTRLGNKTASDCHKRLIEMYGSVVKGIPRSAFEGKSYPSFPITYQKAAGEGFPDADDQLVESVLAVFRSWDNQRAKDYRAVNNIPDDWGTAVVIQAMVFGNAGMDSCTGVMFTRNPDTGENKAVGEFLPNAQGEDVVAGTVTPRPLEEMMKWNEKVAKELLYIADSLEIARKDVQDIEFTVEKGKLYILQTRNAKRSSIAAMQIAVDMAKTGMITSAEAVKRVKRADFLNAYRSVIDPKFTTAPKYTGIPASNGIASGIAVGTAVAAVEAKKKGLKVILVRDETDPDDFGGMVAADGVLTMTGGATSHAAVVARAINKPTVVGLKQKVQDFINQVVTIDGGTGRVWVGDHVPVVEGGSSPALKAFINLMTKEAKVKLIDSGVAQLIDVSGMGPKQATWTVKKALELLKGQIVVDLTDADRDPDFTAFLDWPDREVPMAQMLKGELTKEELERLVFLSELKLPAGMQRMPTVSTLSQLVGVKNSTFIFTGSMNEDNERVLGWLKKDGHVPVTVGIVEPGGFASAFQLAEKLLT